MLFSIIYFVKEDEYVAFIEVLRNKTSNLRVKNCKKQIPRELALKLMLKNYNLKNYFIIDFQKIKLKLKEKFK